MPSKPPKPKAAKTAGAKRLEGTEHLPPTPERPPPATVFVRHLPDDTAFRPPRTEDRFWGDGTVERAEWKCFVRPTDAERPTTRDLANLEYHFRETGNPLYALEAFRASHAAKLYPPLWVLSFVDSRFRLAFRDRLSLDEAFGLSTRGKGRRTPPGVDAELRIRNRNLCLAVFKLEGAGLTRTQACNALAARLARIDGEIWVGGSRKFPLRPMNMTGKGLAAAVAGAEAEWNAEHAATLSAAEHWTVDDRRSLLSLFLKSELPRPVVQQLWPAKRKS